LTIFPAKGESISDFAMRYEHLVFMPSLALKTAWEVSRRKLLGKLHNVSGVSKYMKSVYSPHAYVDIFRLYNTFGPIIPAHPALEKEANFLYKLLRMNPFNPADLLGFGGHGGKQKENKENVFKYVVEDHDSRNMWSNIPTLISVIVYWAIYEQMRDEPDDEEEGGEPKDGGEHVVTFFRFGKMDHRKANFFPVLPNANKKGEKKREELAKEWPHLVNVQEIELPTRIGRTLRKQSQVHFRVKGEGQEMTATLEELVKDLCFPMRKRSATEKQTLSLQDVGKFSAALEKNFHVRKHFAELFSGGTITKQITEAFDPKKKLKWFEKPSVKELQEKVTQIGEQFMVEEDIQWMETVAVREEEEERKPPAKKRKREKPASTSTKTSTRKEGRKKKEKVPELPDGQSYFFSKNIIKKMICPIPPELLEADGLTKNQHQVNILTQVQTRLVSQLNHVAFLRELMEKEKKSLDTEVDWMKATVVDYNKDSHELGAVVDFSRGIARHRVNRWMKIVNSPTSRIDPSNFTAVARSPIDLDAHVYELEGTGLSEDKINGKLLYELVADDADKEFWVHHGEEGDGGGGADEGDNEGSGGEQLDDEGDNDTTEGEEEEGGGKRHRDGGDRGGGKQEQGRMKDDTDSDDETSSDSNGRDDVPLAQLAIAGGGRKKPPPPPTTTHSQTGKRPGTQHATAAAKKARPAATMDKAPQHNINKGRRTEETHASHGKKGATVKTAAKTPRKSPRKKEVAQSSTIAEVPSPFQQPMPFQERYTASQKHAVEAAAKKQQTKMIPKDKIPKDKTTFLNAEQVRKAQEHKQVQVKSIRRTADQDLEDD